MFKSALLYMDLLYLRLSKASTLTVTGGDEQCFAELVVERQHQLSRAARMAAGGGAHGTMAVHSRSSSDRSTQAGPGVPADAAAQAAQWGSASAAIAAARRGLSPAARPAGSSFPGAAGGGNAPGGGGGVAVDPP